MVARYPGLEITGGREGMLKEDLCGDGDLHM